MEKGKYEIELRTNEEVSTARQEIERANLAVYSQRKYISKHRIDSLVNISKLTGEDYSIEELSSFEDHAHKYTPTIGIEIEIYDSALLSKEEKQLPTKEQSSLIKQKKRTLEKIEEAGIPRDEHDPDWWEFAFKPTSSSNLLIAEVQAIEDLGVIRSGERYYPLHVTVAGISSENINAGREKIPNNHRENQVFVLVHALEASGIATTAKRLLMPSEATKPGPYWTREHSGVLERDPRDIKGIDFTTAVEIRTFCFNSVESLEEILRSTQLLGTALSAYQDLTEVVEIKSSLPLRGNKTIRRHWSPRLRDSVDLEDAIRLSGIWTDFSHGVNQLFIEAGLRDPNSTWKEPRSKTLLRKSNNGDYGSLANFLSSAEKDKTGQAAVVRSKLKGLIQSATEAVEYIVERDSEDAVQ